jgi:hypothetical protein
MRREIRLVGFFAVFLGLSAFVAGLATLSGSSVPSGGLSCKAVCGLSLLAAEFFGPAFGARMAGFLWIVIGAVVTLVGIMVFRGSRSA